MKALNQGLKVWSDQPRPARDLQRCSGSGHTVTQAGGITPAPGPEVPRPGPPCGRPGRYHTGTEMID
eukprot:752210-Hanusia_phi.AAC.1